MEHSVALITGGPSGVGYAAARALAEEGWRQIIITGRSLAEAQEAAAKLAAETKRQVFTPLELELDTLSSVQSVLAELVKRGRPVDLLLLNAGIMGTKERKLTAAGIEVSMAPLIGHHQLTVGLLRANLLSPDARIVIASSEAARGDVLDCQSQGDARPDRIWSRRGGDAIIRSTLAAELIPREIRVNAVTPGPIDTPIIGKVFTGKDEVAQIREKMTGMVPMKRWGKSEEIAKAVLFLAFDATFTTGAELPVDGGWSQL